MAYLKADNTQLRKEVGSRDKALKRVIENSSAEARTMLATLDRYRVALDRAKDLLNEVSAYGSCTCNIPLGETCLPCQCSLMINEIESRVTSSTLERNDVESDGKRLITVDEACDQPKGSFTKYVQEQERVEAHKTHQRKDV